MLESWIMDVRYAARRLWSRPTYSLLAVLTLALGIGGTAAIYSLVKGLLLDPLPFREEGKVAVFWSPFDWSETEFLYLRGHIPGFSSVAAYHLQDVTLETSDGPARPLPGVSSSAELFQVLGTAPFLGRGFQPGDDRIGAEPVVILSYPMWKELGGRANLVGQRLQIGGTDRTVVGVMPEGFWFPNPTVRVWTARQLDPAEGSGNYALVGRLAPGMRMDAMRPQLAELTRLIGARFTYPAQWDKTRKPFVTPVREYLLGSLRPSLFATLGAMALLLLIACANVAALMLGQMDGRATEMAVRAALGAGRARLMQQVAVEALLIGLAGGAVGAALAVVGFRGLAAALPLGTWTERATLSWSLFGAAMVAALAAAAVVALVPAWTLLRADLREMLSRGRTSGVRAGGNVMESALVVAEVSLAVLMAAGAGLLIRSVVNLYAIQPGIQPAGVAVVDVTLPSRISNPQRLQMLNGLVRELAAEPGVQYAAASHKLPLRGSGSSFDIVVPGRPDLAGTTTYFRIVSRDYLRALGVKLRSGRTFDGSDRADGHVLVVNQALADKYFAGQDAVGRSIQGGYGGGTVVGVVDNVAEAELTDPRTPVQYLLADQIPETSEGQSLVVRMQGGRDPAAALEGLRRTVQRVAPGAAVQQVTTMDRVVTQAVGPVRQIMSLLSVIAALALVLGAVGVYGTISHFVNRRKREFSIRIALGLAPYRVVWQVVRRGTVPVAGGIVVGIVGMLAAARLLAAFLYGVGASDPLSLAAASAALLVAGIVAAFVPAYRASRNDPAAALREQ
ncbi:MAG: permease [Gemmatimonadetes bacterium]|nr:permease [Gemmatimonadota bacterium]